MTEAQPAECQHWYSSMEVTNHWSHEMILAGGGKGFSEVIELTCPRCGIKQLYCRVRRATEP